MNKSRVDNVSLQTLPGFFKREFKYDVDLADAIEIMDFVLRQTGGLATKKYLYKGKIGTVNDFELELPCNVHSIEWVCQSLPLSIYTGLAGTSSNWLINYRVDPSLNGGIYNENIVGIEDIGPDTGVYSFKENVIQRPSGALMDYINVNQECMQFDFNDVEVDVVYNGVEMDEKNIPLINRKSLEAIAYYIRYVDLRAEYYRGETNAGILAHAEKEYKKRIEQGRVPDFMNRNEMDALLNVLTSNNRKRHNINYFNAQQ